jgi:hypothetical protein
MTTLLAIEHSPVRCFDASSAAVGGVARTCAAKRRRDEAFDDRPPIPRVVIDWPIGAGDPATDIAAREGFRVIELKRPRRRTLVGEAVAVGLLFVGLLAFAGLRVGSSPETTRLAKTPHVDARIVDVRPAAAPQAAPAPEVAQRRSGAVRG